MGWPFNGRATVPRPSAAADSIDGLTRGVARGQRAGVRGHRERPPVLTLLHRVTGSEYCAVRYQYGHLGGALRAPVRGVRAERRGDAGGRLCGVPVPGDTGETAASGQRDNGSDGGDITAGFREYAVTAGETEGRSIMWGRIRAPRQPG
ncbi:hypothetical protein AAFF_G00133550 [Aldrovandia affinis]|uniref:Uncharacterized protein n=1 Tax=Aldrovandia affinis TaxID=143900 RepID=A0AAD7RQG5_9TELE|nr:hypothetical protein AAFF_G00133550 [Aldrovandia affinis]